MRLAAVETKGITGTAGVSPEEIVANLDQVMDVTDAALMTFECRADQLPGHRQRMHATSRAVASDMELIDVDGEAYIGDAPEHCWERYSQLGASEALSDADVGTLTECEVASGVACWVEHLRFRSRPPHTRSNW